ncbi:hypothetical protein EMCRGX_G004304 [Ephydatia muelleri]
MVQKREFLDLLELTIRSRQSSTYGTQMKRLDFLIQKHQKIYVRRDFNIENEAEDIAARRHFRGDERLIRLGKALEVIFLFLRRSSLLAGKQSAHPML